MPELELSVNDAHKVKRKYTKTGLHSKKYKAFKAKGKKSAQMSTDSAPEPEVKPVKYVDTSLAKYHSFEEHSTFKRCNGCGSILRTNVTGCQYCVRKDRQG